MRFISRLFARFIEKQVTELNVIDVICSLIVNDQSYFVNDRTDGNCRKGLRLQIEGHAAPTETLRTRRDRSVQTAADKTKAFAAAGQRITHIKSRRAGKTRTI